jgi:hypothetical protein
MKEDVPSARSLDGQASLNGDIEEGEVDEQEEVVVGEQAAYNSGEKASVCYRYCPCSGHCPFPSTANFSTGPIFGSTEFSSIF